jgi:hypothetical protein
VSIRNSFWGTVVDGVVLIYLRPGKDGVGYQSLLHDIHPQRNRTIDLLSDLLNIDNSCAVSNYFGH